MKVPELTITELLEIMKMIEANLDGLMFILAKNAEILFIRAELRLQKNLHEKLLMSVGMGEDMKEVTLKEAVDKIKASAKR
jgi:tRNA A37 N6-isopentenylltransferase MiaA